MKETVSSMTLFKIIIALTFLFAAFLSVAILYNRVFKMKNQVTSIIEKYEGVHEGDNGSIKIINNYLINNGYNTTGRCEEGQYGVADLNNYTYESVQANKKYYYCLSYYCKDDDTCSTDRNNNKIFFRVHMFFKFDLLYFGELLTFKISGDTKEVYYDGSQILS